MIIGEVYRVPDTNINKFNETYEQILHTIANESKRVVVGADQNIDLLKAHEHSGTGYFVDMKFSYVEAPTVTPITQKSATFIDNFYVSSSLLNVAKTRIIVSDISDHFPILLQITGERAFKSKPLTFTARKFNETSIGQIKEHLGAHTWNGYENYTPE